MESDITDAAIDSITWNLRDALWSPMHTWKDDTRSKAERIAEADAILTEYHDLILAVSTALINTGVDETAADVERNVKGENATELSKSLSERDVTLTEVTKARDEAATTLAELSKDVTTKDEEMTAVQKTLADTSTELETTKKSLEDSTKELTTMKARKSFAVGKFGETITLKEDGTPAKKSTGEAWLEHELGITPERTAA